MGIQHNKPRLLKTPNQSLVKHHCQTINEYPRKHNRYQFHVLDAAENTGGFHCNLSGSMTLLPFIFSFAFCLSLLVVYISTVLAC